MTGTLRHGTPIAAGLFVGGLLVAASLAVAGSTGSATLPLVATALVGAAIAGVALLAVDPAWPLSGAVALSVLSGHWPQAGFPLPLDRVLFAVGVVSLALRLPLKLSEWSWPRLQPVTALIASGVYVLISSWRVGTITHPKTYYELIDSHGFEPWAYFILAPLASGRPVSARSCSGR